MSTKNKDKNQKKTNNVTTAFSLPQETMDKILDDAEKQTRSPSQIMRRIVNDHYGVENTY